MHKNKEIIMRFHRFINLHQFLLRHFTTRFSITSIIFVNFQSLSYVSWRIVLQLLRGEINHLDIMLFDQFFIPNLHLITALEYLLIFLKVSKIFPLDLNTIFIFLMIFILSIRTFSFIKLAHGLFSFERDFIQPILY